MLAAKEFLGHQSQQILDRR